MAIEAEGEARNEMEQDRIEDGVQRFLKHYH